jgi:oleate hydratase
MTAYLVGGGIASLSAAVFLIRDAGFPGPDIHILEELPRLGGALDGSGDPMGGFVARGGRMLEEEAYVCLWNLLDTIPTLTDASTSVKDEIWAFNATWPTDARARLISANRIVEDAADLGFDNRDRIELTRLLALTERAIGSRRIDELFSEHFFATHFWTLWRTTFAFQNWHSAVELKRYFLRFIQEFPRVHTLAGVRRTRLNQYDSIVAPIQAWLDEHGVVIEHGVRVTDVDFGTDPADRRITRLYLSRDGRPGAYDLGAGDLAFLTIGSMTADSAQGDDHHPAALVRDKRDGAWGLWENIARKAPDLGHPDAFTGDVDRTKWESFSLTMRSPLLLRRIQEFTGNAPGTGGLMTFADSPWLMSIVVPHQPHFAGQPDNVHTLWGYGLFIDEPGDFVDTTMAEATGQQILTELLGHLGFTEATEEIRRTTSVVPVMMPYVTSQFQCRDSTDRPPVVPERARNFALLGQFVEIPEDVVFTVEYSVRGAMHAVYELLHVDLEIPSVYHGLTNPKVAVETLAAAFGHRRLTPVTSARQTATPARLSRAGPG